MVADNLNAESPGSLVELINQGDQSFIEKRYHEARVCYEEAIKYLPNNADVLCNLATTLLQLGQLSLAESNFIKSLQVNPKNPAAINNFATLLGRLGKKREALEYLVSLNDLTPNDPDVLSNIGVVLNQLKRPQDAIIWFDRALNIDPFFSDALYGKSVSLTDLGQLDLAADFCERAILSNPQAADPRLLRVMQHIIPAPRNVLEATNVRLDFMNELSKLDRWAVFDSNNLEALGRVIGDRSPFMLAYRTGNLCGELSYYGGLAAKAVYAYWHAAGLLRNLEVQHRCRVRLAIFSLQIRRHSVWDVISKGIVKHLDRYKFELIIYSTGDHVDGETHLARSLADKFIQGPKGHADWLIQIQNDSPDVIFFPEIGMDPLTCKLAALRLAPLQVVSWGHPVTTGLPTIDLYFSGELLEPTSANEHYCEKLVRLPGTGSCTEPYSDQVLSVPSEVLPGLPDCNWVRFVICQRPFKLDPSFDGTLAKLIKFCWPCKVYLLHDLEMPWLSDQVYHRLSQALTKEGLKSDNCLVEIPWLSRPEFLGLLDEMDIYLDMPAFSGYTTAWQAVHRGIPIVTLEGEFMRQRLAAGLLRKIEQTETIAQTEEEYIEIAARLAQECRDPELRAKRRAAIKAAAPKADHDVSVVRAFEKTLIEELAARGCTFDFVDQTSETTTKTADPAAATQESTMMNTENNQAAYPWQMLDADLHLHTLTPNYAPTGLLAMLPEHADETRRLKVLDVGCFCGGSGRWIKQKFPGAEVIGIEMLPKAAEVAAADYDKVIVSTFENVDFEVEGLNHGSVDAIIAADVLEHLYNPWQALQRLKPLLAPGGAIYISLPNVRNLNILNALAKGEWQYAGAGILDVTHIRFFTKKQALEMLAQTGWQATEIRINPDPRLMPAFEGKDLSQIQNIELDNLKLTGLSQEDVLELLALQLFIRAEPK